MFCFDTFAPMLKKTLAFLVLLSHINFSMFIAQVDETDFYNKNGQQVDDINSLAEYVDQVILGDVDKTPEDEDDDTARYFHVSKVEGPVYVQQAIELKKFDASQSLKKEYPAYNEEKLLTPYFEIQSPPPDA